MSHSHRGAGESFQDLPDSHGGIGEDIVNLTLSFLNELSVAVPRNQGVALGDEVWALRQRFKVWKDGEQNLDQKLVRAPQVRRTLFMILLPFIWELSQGLSFYRRSNQKTLRKETDRVMEQAANLARYDPPEQEEHLSRTNITDFITAEKYRSFESYVENLYEFSLTLNSLFENIDSPNTQRGQKRSIDEKKPRAMVGIAATYHAISNQTFRGIRRTKRQKNRSLENPGRDSALAGTSSKQSSDSVDSSNVSPIFTQNGNNSSRQPMTDTLTSTSTSHAQESHGYTEPLTLVEEKRIIMVQDGSSKIEKALLGLFDSGSRDCFITLCAVKEANIPISPLTKKKTYGLLGKRKLQVKEYVKPVWRVKGGEKTRQEDKFFVVETLPEGVDM